MKSDSIKFAELAQIITDVIFSEPIINKDTVKPRIKAILNSYMVDNSVRSASALSPETERQKHITAINRGKTELAFYNKKLFAIIPHDKKKDLYMECLAHLKSLGYK